MSSRKGRSASLPPADHRRRPALDSGDLVVWHVAENGHATASYDFSGLPLSLVLQRELAEHFASRLGPEGSWRAIPTSEEVWSKVVIFAGWLSRLDEPPQRLSELTTGIWSAWRLSRADTTAGRREITKIGALLRDHPHIPVATRELLGRRVSEKKPREMAYRSEEFEQIKTIATRKVRSALHRIRENLRLLENWQAGNVPDGTDDWIIGESLDHIARTGDLPIYISTGQIGDRRRPRPSLPHLQAIGPHSWRRLFLTGEEAASLVVLLIATYGWNATPTEKLRVPETSPDPGVDGQTIYRVELEKPRRGHAHSFETRNLTDWGAGSPGRLIAQAIELTAPARAVLAAEGTPTDRLIVWRLNRVRNPERPNPARAIFRDRLDAHAFRNLLRIWRNEHGPEITVNLRRLRKTVIVLHRRVPTQHTQDTHDQTYVLPDPQTWEQSATVISGGIESALEHTRTAFQARTTRTEVPESDDTATTSCTDYSHSPFTDHGCPCRASFLLCTACPNAVVTPRHLPKLAYLHQVLENLRGVVPTEVWEQDWREPHARLADLRTRPDFTDAEWHDALDVVSVQDRAMIDALLRNGFDE